MLITNRFTLRHEMLVLSPTGILKNGDIRLINKLLSFTINQKDYV